MRLIPQFPARVQWTPAIDQAISQITLLRTLVQRDLAARYKGSVLGNVWPLLNQIAQLLIFTYVFSIVLNVKLSLKGLPPDNSLTFGLWLFAGLSPWMGFASGLLQSATSVLNQSNLVKRVVFPLELIPLVPILSSFIESLLGITALIVACAFLLDTMQPTLALLPLLWLTQLLWTIGLGYLAASFTVFLRDIPQVLGVVVNLWMYATPIVYPLEALPDVVERYIFWVNPMATIAEVNRDLVLVGELNHGVEWLFTVALSLLMCLIGRWVYNRLAPAFADVL